MRQHGGERMEIARSGSRPPGEDRTGTPRPRGDSLALGRRAFLRAAGAAALALPTEACTRVGPPPTKRPESAMEITRVGSQPSAKGPAEWFTGTVRIDPLFPAHDPARAGGASVTFEPG